MKLGAALLSWLGGIMLGLALAAGARTSPAQADDTAGRWSSPDRWVDAEHGVACYMVSTSIIRNNPSVAISCVKVR